MQIVDGQSALLVEGTLTDDEVELRVAIIKGVGPKVELRECEMVDVQALCLFDKVLVHGQRARLPVEMSDGIETLEQVEVGLLCVEAAHEGVDGESVARHVQGKGGVAGFEPVDGDLPVVGAGRGVGGYGVAECNVDIGVVEEAVVDIDVLFAEVDAVGFDGECAHLALDAAFGDEVGGVDLHVAEGELVDHDLFFQQRPELHVGHGAMDVCHRVRHAAQ